MRLACEIFRHTRRTLRALSTLSIGLVGSDANSGKYPSNCDHTHACERISTFAHHTVIAVTHSKHPAVWRVWDRFPVPRTRQSRRESCRPRVWVRRQLQASMSCERPTDRERLGCCVAAHKRLTAQSLADCLKPCFLIISFV